MPKVTAITPINHDGVLYDPGESLECTAKQAKTLCGLGSAKMAGNKAVADALPDETETPEKPAAVPKAKPKGAGKAKGKGK